MTARDVATSFAQTVVDEWGRSGLTHAVVSPGSRNTPVSLALVRDGRFTVDVVLDERSAGFRALGIGLATGRPAIACCTSGTAAANLHPAVLEARHARVPLLVLTADRPPELQDCGAGQTVEQARLFGAAVRWFHDPGPPTDGPDVGATWRAFAARAAAVALGPPAGPVHCNLPFREPLVPSGAPLVEAPGRAGGVPWTTTVRAPAIVSGADVEQLAELVRAHPRGVIVAGWGAGVDREVASVFARRAGWPVLADAVSGLRAGACTISTYEALVRAAAFADAHRPELVLRVGAPLTSKIANGWLADAPTVLIDQDDAWLDPAHGVQQRINASAGPFVAAVGARLESTESEWLRSWTTAEARARRALDEVLDDEVACEARIARDVAAGIPDGGTLMVASSLPVRALEWAMAPRTGLRVLANRGVNGIDGFVSTALGIAAANAGPTVGLCGELCFLHDTNGLLSASASAPMTFVVIDNGGGGIFDYLPQHELPEFERLFITPAGVDLAAVAQAHGVDSTDVETVADVAKLVAEPSVKSRVLVVHVDRAAAVEQHRRGWSAVASALG